MAATATTTAHAEPDNPFLGEQRLERIATVNAALLCHGECWIHRRKESATVIDETALRRSVSVDFTLPRLAGATALEPIIKIPDGAGALPVFCPPLFVLPKGPDGLMAFDLQDEAGASLPLMTRDDNGLVSGATLAALAAHLLGSEQQLSPSLRERLKQLAAADTPQHLAAEALLEPLPGDPDTTQLNALAQKDVFSWWTRTLAHSSLVVVPYRDPTIRRKIFHLSYVEPFNTALAVRTRLGWTPYTVVIDSSWIEARNFHLEAEAPPGLRIAKATLNDDGKRKVSSEGFLRRTHLARYNARRAGAATTRLDLRVTGYGFVGGAMIASGLVVVAVAACLIGAEAIAKNPSSAPALLLLLPGVIATYVARPDQHALTTRLLSFARRLLLIAGAVAYGCAAFVALDGGPSVGKDAVADRTSELERVFMASGAVALVCFLGLALGWLLARPAVRRIGRQMLTREWWKRVLPGLVGRRFARSMPFSLPPDVLFAIAERQRGGLAGLGSDWPDEDEELAPASREMTFARAGRLGIWILTLCVRESAGELDDGRSEGEPSRDDPAREGVSSGEPAGEGESSRDDPVRECELELAGEFFPSWFAWPLAPRIVRSEARVAGVRLRKFAVGRLSAGD